MYPQSVESESPYTSKQFNFVQDINGGIYSNNGLSLVQFDLSSIYNSTNLIQPDSMFLAIPITIVNTFVTNAGASIAPRSDNVSAVGLKNGFFQLIHGADCAINGKTVQQFQPFTNAYVAFKTLSMMSQDDLKTLGPSLGMGEFLDNPQSLTFNGTAVSTVSSGTFPSSVVSGGVGGNGLSNNKPFSLSGSSNFVDQSAQGVQNIYTYNNGLASRQKRIIDTTQAPNASGSAGQGLFGPSGGASTSYITNLDNLKKEFKPNYQVVGTYYQTYQDVAIIRIADIFDSFKQLPLMKKLDSVMRFYINTGTVVSNVKTSSGAVTSTGLQMSSGLSNTFTGTCPIMQCTQTSLPIDTGAQVTGLFIGTATATSINAFGLNINLATSAVSHFMPSCRIYYAQVQLKPEKMIPYIAENRAKRVVFTDFLTNTISAISASSSASSLIQSGVSNIRGILLLPFISASTNGANGASGITAFSQLQSPFDSAPATNGPFSLLNLQVAVGGVNQLSNTLNYAWENFLEQTTLYEKLNALDYGLSCGLISENYFEQAYRAYYVDLTRANEADLLTARNLNCSFTNNTLQTLDILVYTEYFKELVVDVETGLINI
jgi:hypothetical protein